MMNLPVIIQTSKNEIGIDAGAASSTQTPHSQIYSSPYSQYDNAEYTIGSYVLWAISIIIIVAIIKSTFNNKRNILYYYIPILSVINVLEVYLYYEWWYYEASFILIPNEHQIVILFLLACNPIYSYIMITIIINIIAWATLMVVIIRAIIKIERSLAAQSHPSFMDTRPE